METINFADLEPITEMCSVLVNIEGKLDMVKINESTMLSLAVEKLGHFEHTGEWKYTNEETEKKLLTLRMEMIMRNLMLNDEHAKRLTDRQLEGYLTGAAYLHTRHYPPLEYVRSVIKVYRGFLNAKENAHNCVK